MGTMTRVWLFYCGKAGLELRNFNRVSRLGNSSFPPEKFPQKGFIGIGWDRLGDLSTYSKPGVDPAWQLTRYLEDFRRYYGRHEDGKQKGEEKRPAPLGAVARQLWNFAFKMEVGHIIICPFRENGRQYMLRGLVTGIYEYSPGLKEFRDLPDRTYVHIREVAWTNIFEKQNPSNKEWDLIKMCLPRKPVTLSDATAQAEKTIRELRLDENITKPLQQVEHQFRLCNDDYAIIGGGR